MRGDGDGAGAANVNCHWRPGTWHVRQLQAVFNLYQSSENRGEIPGSFGFMYGTGPVVSWYTYAFVVSNGTRYMDLRPDGKWRAAFNTPEAAETIYFLLRLTREKFTTDSDAVLTGAAFAPLGGGREMNLKWDRGEIGMNFAYLSFERGMDLNPAVVGIAPVPQAPFGDSSSELNSGMLGVFSGSSPEQQLGVMKYIWFRTGERAEEIRTRSFVDAGYGTFLDPSALERFGYHDVLERIPEDWRTTVETAFKSGVPEPYGNNTQLIYEYVSAPINWALERPELLELPEAEALRRIQEQLKFVFQGSTTGRRLGSRSLSSVLENARTRFTKTDWP